MTKAAGSVSDASETVAKLAESISATNQSLDAFFTLTMAIVVYFMQCGFAFLEAGAVRSKNTTNILIKNILDSFIAGIAYYSVGWALAFGKPANPFCGFGQFFLAGMPDHLLYKWFFHFVFAATAATIVSGAVAERCEFVAYLVYSLLITGIVYPIASHWAWDSSGWLAEGITIRNGTVKSSFIDFAGSGVVHVTGGAAAFVAAAVLGPRLNRFDPNTGAPVEIRGHSVPLASLGGFILFFGFFAFNGGSQASISRPGDGAAVAAAMTATIISASVSAFTALLLQRSLSSHWSLLRTVNAGLAGMVAACAGCDQLQPWAACLLGLVSAGAYCLWSNLLLRLRVDDPLDAVAVHLGGGAWGCVAVALLRKERGLLLAWDAAAGLDLLMQIIGLFAIAAWAAAAAAVAFISLKFAAIFRVSGEVEVKGLDYPKHGEMAYPLTAYGHGWHTADAVPEIGSMQLTPEEAVAKLQRFESTENQQNSVTQVEAAIASAPQAAPAAGNKLQHVADLAVTYM